RLRHFSNPRDSSRDAKLRLRARAARSPGDVWLAAGGGAMLLRSRGRIADRSFNDGHLCRFAAAGTRTLLAGTAFTSTLIAVTAGHPQSAFAACAGENTSSVTCDASHPATAGTLDTSFGGTTVVNVNPGGAITTGGASATVTGPGTLTFNNNDTTFGISSSTRSGVTLTNNNGASFYVGNANVSSTAGAGVIVSATSGQDLTVTNNGTVTSTSGDAISAGLSGLGTGKIVINGSGN